MSLVGPDAEAYLQQIKAEFTQRVAGKPFHEFTKEDLMSYALFGLSGAHHENAEIIDALHTPTDPIFAGLRRANTQIDAPDGFLNEN